MVMIKNILYFILGIVYLPIMLIIKAIRYIRDLGKELIYDYQYSKRVDANLKKLREMKS